jgi:hypothetical protein
LILPIHQGPVTKSRRLSVEAHPALIIENMMLDEEVEELGLDHMNLNNDDDENSDEEVDVLLHILSGGGGEDYCDNDDEPNDDKKMAATVDK